MSWYCPSQAGAAWGLNLLEDLDILLLTEVLHGIRQRLFRFEPPETMRAASNSTFSLQVVEA